MTGGLPGHGDRTAAGQEGYVADSTQVTVEFFGVPRQRAGRAELAVEAASVAELLAAVECACPGLKGLVRPDGRLAPHYLLSVGGQRFVTDTREALPAGTRLLLLSADAGG
jgi:molybdopterin converting factor small subunit